MLRGARVERLLCCSYVKCAAGARCPVVIVVVVVVVVVVLRLWVVWRFCGGIYCCGAF